MPILLQSSFDTRELPAECQYLNLTASGMLLQWLEQHGVSEMVCCGNIVCIHDTQADATELLALEDDTTAYVAQQ